jgi:hypothetical protein
MKSPLATCPTMVINHEQTKHFITFFTSTETIPTLIL